MGLAQQQATPSALGTFYGNEYSFPSFGGMVGASNGGGGGGAGGTSIHSGTGLAELFAGDLDGLDGSNFGSHFGFVDLVSFDPSTWARWRSAMHI